MARVAALTTMLEFGRLLGAAPLDWLKHRRESPGSDDDGNDPSETP
jgi:hypothetical protein